MSKYNCTTVHEKNSHVRNLDLNSDLKQLIIFIRDILSCILRPEYLSSLYRPTESNHRKSRDLFGDDDDHRFDEKVKPVEDLEKNRPEMVSNYACIETMQEGYCCGDHTTIHLYRC